jgi:hypothetical protein
MTEAVRVIKQHAIREEDGSRAFGNNYIWAGR